MRRKILTSMGLLVGLLVIGSQVSAHHGSRISYDMTKTVTMQGVVTEFDWQNPHVFFLYDVTDDKGNVTHWAAETNPPSGMVHDGWNKNYLKPGDKVTVSVWQAKTGAPRGFLAKLITPDGKVTEEQGGPPE